MRSIIFLLFVTSGLSYGHGGDSGPSSLEQEFSKMSHIHLPMNFNTLEGLTFGYPTGKEHGEHLDTHTDEHEGEHGGDEHAEEAALELDIHPVVFAGYDKVNRYLNLEESTADVTEIESAGQEDKYLHIRSRRWNLGLGVEADMHLPLPIWSFAVGVSYIKAKNYISKMLLDYRSESRESLSFPFNSAALNNWRVGESISYMSSGSIVFATMLGIEPFFHFGPEYIHTGSYQTNIKLIEQGKLRVELITTKTHSIGLEGNAVVAGFEASKGHGRMSNVSYELDLSSKSSFKALRYLHLGRVDLITKELLDSSGKIVLEGSSKNNYQSMTGSFGFPVLFFRGFSRGNYVLAGEVRDYQHDETEKIYSTTDMSEKFSRGVLSRHLWQTKSFTSTIVQELDKQDESIISSQYHYSFSNDNMRFKEFSRKLKQLSKQYDLPLLAELSLKYKKNGFIKIDSILNLKGEDILFLLNGKRLEELLNMAKGKTSRREEKSLLKKYSKLKSIKRDIERLYSLKKLKKVTKKVSKFMKTLISSKTMVRALMDIRSELKLNLKVVGDRIRQHHYECNRVCELE